MTKVPFYLFAWFYIAFCSAWAEEGPVSSKASARVLAVLSTNGIKDAHSEYIFSAVALDSFGQVIFYRRFDSSGGSRSFQKIGQESVPYTNVRITNNPTGEINFSFEKCTAGSSVIVIGRDGSLKDIFNLPKGVFAHNSTGSYFANIKIASVADLPFDENTIDPRWLTVEGVQGLSLESVKND